MFNDFTRDAAAIWVFRVINELSGDNIIELRKTTFETSHQAKGITRFGLVKLRGCQ
jgi:hypothetical protein